MKRMLILALCAVMTFGAFVTPARAAGMPQSQMGKELLERNGPGGPPRRRPPPPPPPRRGYRRDYGRRGGGDGWVGFGVGAAIGTAIGALIANQAPAPQPSMVFDPACNCYYYR